MSTITEARKWVLESEIRYLLAIRRTGEGLVKTAAAEELAARERDLATLTQEDDKQRHLELAATGTDGGSR
jgi:hypothetical protein